MDKFNGMWTYVLRCEGPSYYVGKSEQLRKRIKDHFSGRGSRWTRSHKPRTIVMVLPGDVERDTYWDIREMAGPIVFGAGNTRGVLR
jgi:predicted GIY-YIG superfamily endonuclease